MASKTLLEIKTTIESRLAGLDLGWDIYYPNDKNANVVDGQLPLSQFIKIGDLIWSTKPKGFGSRGIRIGLEGTVVVAVYDKVGAGQGAILDILERIEVAFNNTSADGIKYQATHSTSVPVIEGHDGLAITIKWQVD